MQVQRKELNFNGENIYAGIDVHLKSWNVSIFTEHLFHKTFTQSANAEALCKYLQDKFPCGVYHSVYEAGFSGFWAHYKLKEMGINNIVVNAADVPTSQKEHLQKDDPTDSKKLARSLRSGDLTAIYVPSSSTLEERSLVRFRSTLVKDMTRFRQRIKSFLYFYGITFPPIFEKTGTHWSKKFMKWLKEEVVMSEEAGRQALDLLLQQAQEQRKLLLEVTRKLRTLSRRDKYDNRMRLLRTIPGIGFVTAITFLTEIDEISSFRNTDHFAGYIGLVPTRHCSGNKTNNDGEMTFRGRDLLRGWLIESSWCAAKLDPALSYCFNDYCKRMEPNKAIIKIARKLLNRIYYVMKENKEYVSAVVK